MYKVEEKSINITAKNKTALWPLLPSTWQLLRFKFSFFLMPVYWFALSQVVNKNWPRAILIFCILHLLVYPASNGYNSYMDRDEESVGGIQKPMQPTRQLFLVTVIMDVTALLLGFFISIYFVLALLAYILASRAYSYRGIRIKKYPVPGYLLVIFFQGAVTYFMVYHGSHANLSLHVHPGAMLASSLLVGGFYPLTQVYQHEADKRDGVKTISIMLGIRGTFIFTVIIYAIAMAVLSLYLFYSLEIMEVFVLATCMLPIIVFFFIWAFKVWKDPAAANYTNTMRMNTIASFGTNIGFILVMLMQ